MGVTHFDGLDAVSSFYIGGVQVTATAAELNAIAGGGLSSTELGLLDTATAGSITASKVVTRDAASSIPLKGAVLAATGNSQGTAAAIASQVTLVTSADNTTAVKLPTAVIGQTFIVINTVSNKTLPVYPATGAAINGGGANAAFTVGPGKLATFHCTALLTWYADLQSAATPNTTELALLAGAGTGGTPVASKAQIADANQNIGVIKGTALHLGTSGSETQVTASAAELNYNDRTGGVGVAEASKTAVLGTDKNLDEVHTAALYIGAAAGTQVTSTAAELNILDGVPTTAYTGGLGVVAGTGVAVSERGFGYFKTSVFTLTNAAVALTDEAGVIAYGGLKIYDFPQGYIYMQSAVADLAITKSSAGVNDDWDGDIALGTVTATNDADLTSTEADIIPKTATPQAAAGATTGDCVSTATEHAILDGTSTAKDLFVNLLVDDADHNVAGTACNLILNGTITVNWIFMGDN